MASVRFVHIHTSHDHSAAEMRKARKFIRAACALATEEEDDPVRFYSSDNAVIAELTLCSDKRAAEVFAELNRALRLLQNRHLIIARDRVQIGLVQWKIKCSSDHRQ